MSEAAVFAFSDIDWETPEQAPDGLRELSEKGWSQGARRKFMTGGEGGYHVQHSYMPPGFEVPPHRHDHDELFVVLEGSCRLSDGRWLTDYDMAVIDAGQEYGFEVGPVGLRFVVVRQGQAATTLSE